MPTRFKGGLAVGKLTDGSADMTALQKIFAGRESVNLASIGAGVDGEATITVTGADSTATNVVIVTINGDINDGLVVESADVTAANTVTVRVLNTTAGALDAAALDFSYLVIEL